MLPKFTLKQFIYILIKLSIRDSRWRVHVFDLNKYVRSRGKVTWLTVT